MVQTKLDIMFVKKKTYFVVQPDPPSLFVRAGGNGYFRLAVDPGIFSYNFRIFALPYKPGQYAAEVTFN